MQQQPMIEATLSKGQKLINWFFSLFCSHDDVFYTHEKTLCLRCLKCLRMTTGWTYALPTVPITTENDRFQVENTRK